MSKIMLGENNPFYGKSHNKDTRKQLSEYQKKNSPLKKRIKQVDPDTGKVVKVWDSVREASRKLNFKSPTSISNVLRGRRKSAGGYYWKYY